jgi:ribonucleoside-triphosphate reductase
MASSAAHSYSSDSIATIAVPADILDVKQINALLNGYTKYVNATPLPRIGLAIASSSKINDSLEHVATAVRSGGIISIGRDLRASGGIRKSPINKEAAATMILHSLSINLPRLAYESNKDETYFRAKLALMIKPSLAAVSMRKKTIISYIRKGLIPAFASSTQMMQRGTSSIVINLTGIKESVYGILGYKSSDGTEVMQKVLKTAAEVIASQGKQLGEDAVGIAMVSDNSGARFAAIDSEKYGRVSLLQSQNTATYSQGIMLNGKDVLLDRTVIPECISVDKLLNGGCAIGLDMTDLSQVEIQTVIQAAYVAELPFFRPYVRLAVCASCGRRSQVALENCEFCKSPHIMSVHS